MKLNLHFLVVSYSLKKKKNAFFNSCQKWCFKEGVTAKHRDEFCRQSFILEVHKPHRLADGLSHWCWDPVRVKSERPCECKGKLVLRTWKSCPHSHITAPTPSCRHIALWLENAKMDKAMDSKHSMCLVWLSFSVYFMLHLELLGWQWRSFWRPSM